MVREARADGRTVFFSSHNLSEVQVVCDRVGIIREGRLVATERVEDLVARRMNRISLRFDELPAPGTFDYDGVTELERGQRTVLLEVRENLPRVLAAASERGIIDIETHNIGLEEIFLAYYGRGNGGDHA
jgi:ABC-2 type transport system ATP-binding protein